MLPPFGARLGGRNAPTLDKMGVEVQLGAMVTDVDADGIEVQDGDGTACAGSSRATKIWAAGVQASPLAERSPSRPARRLDRAGRIGVNPDLTLPGHPEVFVVGDMIDLDNLPGVAQVAIQGAEVRRRGDQAAARRQAAAEAVPLLRQGLAWRPSRGSPRWRLGQLRFGGFLAWMVWLVVHLFYLVGFKSRITTLLHWLISFLGRGRSERMATQQQVYGRLALEHSGRHFEVSKTGGLKTSWSSVT